MKLFDSNCQYVDWPCQLHISFNSLTYLHKLVTILVFVRCSKEAFATYLNNAPFILSVGITVSKHRGLPVTAQFSYL